MHSETYHPRAAMPPTAFGSRYTNCPTTHTYTTAAMFQPVASTRAVMPSTYAASAIGNLTAATVASASSAAMPLLQSAPTAASSNASAATTCSMPLWEPLQNFQHFDTFPNPSIPAITMPRKIQDLPEFSGDPDDWPLFYTAFNQSTAAYGYTNLENNQRLHKFGRPEQLIHSQLRQARELPQISENNLGKLVPFSTKVKNLAVFLQSVNGQNHIANPTLLEELVSKLPMSKKLEWARVATQIQPYPTIIHFSDWLCEIANLICIVQDVEYKDQKRRVLLHSTGQQIQCPMCQGQHRIYDCRRFLNLNVPDRWKQVKKNRACFSCLHTGHITRDCRRRRVCPEEGCERRHHKLLHECTTPCVPPPTLANPDPKSQQNVLSCNSEDKKKLLFRVLPVTLYGNNCSMEVYALFDDGSSITMMDSDIAEKIGIRGKNTSLNVQWFGGRSAREPVTSFNIKSLSQDEILSAFKNCKFPPVKPYSNVVPKLLIGLDHASLGLPSNCKINNEFGPFACNTELGWVVFGPCHSLSSIQKSSLFISVENKDELHQIVADYFNVEGMGVRSAPLVESDDDVRAKRILEETTQRIGDRFQTGLLWKQGEIRLPDSYPMALSRLEGIERKMKRDPKFSAAYREIIDKYIEKGYVRKLQSDEVRISSERKWYLPHFGVVNPNKPEKLRLVFDAAAKVNNISLNSMLLKGPQNIASLLTILYNFRRGKIAVGADICEMFHQVKIQPSDRVSQRFLWRDGNQKEPPGVYEMQVMIFGAACSPCSAIFVMKANAKEHLHYNPRAIEAISENHYVDDFVDSFESVDEAIIISKQVKEIHKNGGFELRNFISNSKDVSQTLDGSLKAMPINNGAEKVLGLYWEPSSDTFMFNLKFNRVDSSIISGELKPTKRKLLSIIMSIFDPLGLLGHFTVGGKLLMRQIWKHDCRWDDIIPDDLHAIWERWRGQMKNVAKFSVPRHYFQTGLPTSLQLHIFVDASEDAFAAVAYWRYISNEYTDTSFITSKIKCAPLKKVTIPRLELQAAVLGTRLMQTIMSSHILTPEKIVLWSDSTTVLRWIASSHRQYKQYVAHRISEILSSTKIENWRWVPTSENVADEGTRSFNNIDFSMSSRWLRGPAFLRMTEHDWPTRVIDTTCANDIEENHPKTSLLIVENDFIDFNRFSSFTRIIRSTCWIIRFVKRCRNIFDDSEQYGLTSRELNCAEEILCRLVQRERFSAELSCIEKGQPVSKNSSLISLSPYIDGNGLLRVYGRIDAASYLSYNVKRPIILPKNHQFTKLLVMHHHRQMMHQNHEATVCEIRKKYWIPQVRSLLKTVVAECFLCRSRKCLPRLPIMGQLPLDRLDPNIPPFKYTGLDYFGPITVTIGRRSEKRWVALFTCLTIRAIHLELAHDLSTDSCIIAIRNFINRRGVPTRIRSDNGTNFIGANEESKRFTEAFDANRIQSELSKRGIEWIFNCPANPSEGGAWERMVQCVKKVLRHTLKEISPREHVLQSLLIEAENIVNSRPLTHLPISPDEEEPLTPNHFLIGSGNVAPTPPVNEPDGKLFSLKKQWRVLRCLRDRFWKRWIAEYLPTLTRRVKWCEYTQPISAGNVVFICDPNVPRSQWRRGLVTCVYTGTDGVPRRADVKTSSGVLQRPVSKLAVLDIEISEADRSTGVGVL
ncbi:uncharacterized protein LOC131802044 [Musca domestica]|uniref:Uncharacterized protein LOC131802044 n=1 Tax=Musca domestica TaxID=7370 RepID=A0ABM3UV22_MUSDO|nr:uncharacterized protein LOC131802044 [Musca domestica]